MEQEEDSGVGLLRFGARAGASDAATGEQAFFLLQMESRPPPQPESEPEPEQEPEPELTEGEMEEMIGFAATEWLAEWIEAPEEDQGLG